MPKFLRVFVFFTALSLILPTKILATPAFLGAEGFGASTTTGGRGGTVYFVTNTNDSGQGSLRECVQASGPRTCVFRTGGLITLTSPLTISNGNITIAGQTAPGGGISIKSDGKDVFNVKADNIIIRYISARTGHGLTHAINVADNGNERKNLIFDHMTMSWAGDKIFLTWYRVLNMTASWNIISEALDYDNHSKGALLGGYKGEEGTVEKGSEDLSFHHNLMAHNGERGPLLEVCGTAQVINNVTYNPYWTFAHHQNCCPGGIGYSNWIGNFHKRGPDSTSNSDLKVIPEDSGDPAGIGAKIYLYGNIGPSRTSDSLPQENWIESGSRGFLVSSPASAPNITSTDAFTAYDQVLSDAGNSKGLDCGGNWVSRRDTIDTRIVNDVKNGTGHIINDPMDVGGWITPSAGSACPDNDGDGMPDAFESSHGFNLNSNDANLDSDNDGYTNLEEYLNGSGDDVYSPVPTPTQTATPTQTSHSTATPTATSTSSSKTPTATPTATGTSQAKTGDVNNDNRVNIIDIGIIIDNYSSQSPNNPRADVNSDGIVNIIDIGLVIDNYES